MNDGVRITPQEHANLIFFQRNLALVLWYSPSCRGLRAFGPRSLELRCHTTLVALGKQLEGIREGSGRVFGDLKLQFEAEQFEVGLSNIAHQREHDSAANFLRREVLRAGRFIESPQAPQNVRSPAHPPRRYECACGRPSVRSNRSN